MYVKEFLNQIDLQLINTCSGCQLIELNQKQKQTPLSDAKIRN